MIKIGMMIIILLFPTHSLANDFHNLINNKSSVERNTFFKKFLTVSGESCNRVTKTFFQGFDEEKTTYWNVACSNNLAYGISIKSDTQGTTEIMDCSILKALKIDCFKKFEG